MVTLFHIILGTTWHVLLLMYKAKLTVERCEWVRGVPKY